LIKLLGNERALLFCKCAPKRLAVDEMLGAEVNEAVTHWATDERTGPQCSMIMED
jgi:hypothetical protein